MQISKDLRLIIFFAAITILVTAGVIIFWENLMMEPFFAWVNVTYPGEANRLTRWKIEQRVEHFFISVAVDVIVVTLLLRLVRRQQRKLSASEERYRALFEHANDGIGVLTATDHRLVEVNNRFVEIFGSQTSELIGRSVSELQRGASVDITDVPSEPLSTLLGTAASGEYEFTIRTSGGQLRPVLVSFSTLTADGEKLINLIVRDLSERRRLEAEKEIMQAQLMHDEKITALGQMAAQVTHEVKNPLAGLRLYTLHLKSKVNGKLSASEMSLIDKISHTIDHLSATTEQILNFTRPFTLRPHRADLNCLVKDTLHLLEPQLADGKVDVRLQLSASPTDGLIDEASMGSALFNLLLNSIQAMSANGGEGTLTVSSHRDDDSLQLVIEDTGCGMSEEQVRKVFEPFYTTKSKGFGLGMPYAKRVVEAHHGSIMIESHEEVGTTVTVKLPAAI